jgi:hypothetical protein
MASESDGGILSRIWAAIGGGLVALVGLVIAGGGAWLIYLVGSPYYLLAGAGVVGDRRAAGPPATRGRAGLRRRPGRHPGLGLVGDRRDFWPLRAAPGGARPSSASSSCWCCRPPQGAHAHQRPAGGGRLGRVIAATLGSALPATYTWGQAPRVPGAGQGRRTLRPGLADWRYLRENPGGARYAPVDQINRENVES